MPNSQHDLLMGPTGLRDYLSKALPDSQLMEVSADAHYQPILLLTTPQVTAGFGFSNGDMGKSYEVLYGGFKSQYIEQRTEWDARDLAFVFCVPPESPGLGSILLSSRDRRVFLPEVRHSPCASRR